MNQYFEQMILSASPVEIVNLLYQKAIRSVRDAREHLQAGRIQERSAKIGSAVAVLSELMSSLDFDNAPELSGQLHALYVYMQNQLVDANLKQAEAPLSEVLMLLSTMAEGWAGILEDEKKQPAQPSWAVAPAGENQLSRFAVSA